MESTKGFFRGSHGNFVVFFWILNYVSANG